MRGPGSRGYAQCPDLFLPFFNKGNQGFLEKWLILELEQEIYEMSLEYLVVVESKSSNKHHSMETTVQEAWGITLEKPDKPGDQHQQSKIMLTGYILDMMQ